ncbi:MAG TPA: hypothetical protein VIP77_00890 [Jiangellaceae bacterium]
MKTTAIRVSSIAQRHFWVPLTISTILGLVAPARATELSGFIVPVLMAMFFLVCLRVDFTEVVHHVRRPRFIVFVLGIYLVVLPALLYVVVGLVSRDIAIGVLLLTSMPPGMAAPVFTDMLHGRVSLAMALTLAGTIASPFTVFALFSVLTRQTVYLELGDLFLTLLVVNLLPLITAQAVKRWRRAASFVEGVGKHSGAVTLLCLCFIVYVAVAQQASAITSDVLRTAIDLLWLYGVFILLHVAGYWIAPWRTMPDRVAITVSNAYMNNALALGLSVTFFSPRIAFLMALSEIPWNTLPGVLRYVFRRARP